MSNVLTKTDNGATEAARPEEKVYLTPRVNIHEHKDGYVLTAEMPGVGKEGIEVLLDNDDLTIIGHRKPLTEEGQALYRESTLRDYRRVFELDPAIDTERITAQMDQGVLTLELPKAERVKPRKILVK